MQAGAGKHQPGAGQCRRIGNAPGLDMEHRRRRKHAVGLGKAGHIRQGHGEGMQDLRTVAVEDTLRPAGRPRCIAERRCDVFVELRPGCGRGEVIGRLLQQVLVAQQGSGPAGQRHVRRRHTHPVGHQHKRAPPIGAGESRRRLGQERRLDEERRVLGVVEDPGDLVGLQPGIDGVADGAAAGRGIEDFQVPVGAVGEGCYPVTGAHSQRPESARKLPCPHRGSLVAAAVDGLVGCAGNHLAIAVHPRRVLQQAGEQQRPVHHQSLHRHPPSRWRPPSFTRNLSTLQGARVIHYPAGGRPPPGGQFVWSRSYRRERQPAERSATNGL